MSTDATVFIVEDDAAVTDALAGVAKLMNLGVAIFSSSEDFLRAYDSNRPGCLVLDFNLPGQSGLELQRHLSRLGNLLPVIMISGQASVRTIVETMKLGALTFLEKPFSLNEIRREIQNAIDHDAARRSETSEHYEASAKIARLTHKEREVFDLVSGGKTNKEVAKQLEISVRAVEDRRRRVMRKLNVDDLSELIALASKAARSRRN